ncbi:MULTISPECIES: sensor histidine kinase [Streptococcus]|jgi:two-component system sensor histidine kinase AgrC|uniref:sensor histidine kinase n=1 Tax=Streptococcus TaxID=1301 RepID=UPI0006612BF1|nr:MULTISPECIES: GHKL domain-containing protein [Streptococcus]MCY7009597.1 GHKL domain-containing protein [Streptococcus vestibularis]MCY7043040.1 GHKL domain-containing protein [Streptococcus vestibularis]
MDIVINLLLFYSKILVVLLLFQQISNQPIKPLWCIIGPFLYVLLLIICPPVGYFAYFFIFIAYNIYQNKYKSKILDIFYGLYPIIVNSLLGRMLGFYVFPLLGVSVFNEVKLSWYDILIELLVFPLHLLIVKSLRLDFSEIKEGFKRYYFKYLLLLINISMFVYMLLVSILVIYRDKLADADNWRGHINNFYIVLFFVMLLYLNAISKEKLEKEIIDQKDTQLNELSIYSHQVESLYEEIRSFRHDYINILTSLKLGIDNQDIEAIKTVYNGVLRDSGTQFYDSKFDIAKLSNIKNDAIKSILSAKLLEAQNRGISISVEIEEPVSNFRIELLDFITILSVLCDNAIEATIEAISPRMTVAFMNNDDSLVLIVENSTKSEKVDINHIFDRGYSSKGEGRGLGLHNVNSVLEKYPKSTITTRSANHLFSQTIRFCKQL